MKNFNSDPDILAGEIKVASAQLNPTVGDLAGNAAMAREARAEAAALGADLIVFSELFISGYPPEDLVLKPAFVTAAQREIEALAAETGYGGPAMLIGTPWPGKSKSGKPFNAVALLDGGKVQALRFKTDLPNYGVFDEKRVFAQGPMPGPVNFRGVRLGVPICEDIWTPDVCECLAETGAEILISPNGSPWTLTKRGVRMNQAVARVTETGLPLIYVNQVGGQDELVFDGASFALNPGGALAHQAPALESVLSLVTLRRGADGWRAEPGERALVEEGDEAAYRACVLGLRDYVEKNGFKGVLMGLSGGVDSALCAAMAVDALGADRVHCLMLPYRYTSTESLLDAAACAEALGVRYDIASRTSPRKTCNRARAARC